MIPVARRRREPPRLWPRLGRLLLAALFCTQAWADTLTLCYHYGCKKQVSFPIGEAPRLAVAQLFATADNAQAEREAIRHAIALLYREAAQHAPIAEDKGGNFADGTADGRMDCVDHSRNDTTFLQYLARLGLLKQHRVETPVWRAPWIIDLHYASQITETASDTPWVVDSWFFDFGEPPVVVPYQQWKKGYTP